MPPTLASLAARLRNTPEAERLRKHFGAPQQQESRQEYERSPSWITLVPPQKSK